MNKKELRHAFLARRKALLNSEVDARSQQISQLFFDWHTPTPQAVIHLFLPIARQNEVNTWPIVHRLWQDFPSVRVAVSVTDMVTRQLTHYALTPTTTLTENRWHIPEPIASQSAPIPTAILTTVLVPLLVFDQQGHRVGYGGGFYDRFLATCPPDCQKIGLSLEEPIDRIDDIEPTDVPLDACITPINVYWFK